MTGAEKRNTGKIAGKSKVKTMDENGNERGQIYTVLKKVKDRKNDSQQRLKGESRRGYLKKENTNKEDQDTKKKRE